jgi:sulfur dioxygenase
MIFKQLLDKTSFTYTYFLADQATNEAVFIDPVDTNIDLYIAMLEEGNYKLKYSIETHVHADHVTASGMLRDRTGAETAVGFFCGAESADHQLQDGDLFEFAGGEQIHVVATPGHTPGSCSFLWRDRVFTGDALLIGGCGRTDFQGGDPGQLYDSITQRLLTLPDETLVYPGHDYKGNWVSCIIQERLTNPRLAGKTRDEFIGIMENLNLPKPKLIDIAVPANRYCGIDDEEALQIAASEEERIEPSQERRGVLGMINKAKKQIQQIDVETAKQWLNSGDTILLDVRENAEFASGHIEGSLHLPRGMVKAKIETIPECADKSSRYLLYCASGNRSALAALVMQEQGYTNVASLIGGIAAWRKAQ